MTAPDPRARWAALSDTELREAARGDLHTLSMRERDALRMELARRTSPEMAALPVRPLPPVPGVTVHAPQAATYPKASIGRRFVAMLLDGFISYIPLMVTMALTFGTMRMSGAPSAVGVLALAASGLWALYYELTKDGRPNGQSVGKRALGLMVVHVPDNLPCTRGQSAGRNLVRIVAQMVPIVGWLIEPAKLLINEQGRRFGDEIANTQVIEANAYRAPV